MKKILSLFLSFVIVLSSFVGAFSAEAADLNAPTFSKQSGAYTESVSVSLYSSNLLADIYYQIFEYGLNNKKGALVQGVTKYTAPLRITASCYITAWTERNGEASEETTNRYYIKYSSDEGRFSIGLNGYIYAYSGNSSNLVIPETIDGKTVRGIYQNCFSQLNNNDDYSNFLESVTLPDTVIEIDSGAFRNCINLKSIKGKNVTYVRNNAFMNCSALNSIDFPNIENIGSNAFYGTDIKSFLSECVTYLGSFAFCSTALESFEAPNLETLSRNAFTSCEQLKTVNLGIVSELEMCTFSYCNSLESVYAPMLTTIDHRAFQQDNTSFENDVSVYAPKLAGALGVSIRISDNGLRFGFKWNDETDLQQAYGENVEYGFIYAYEETEDLTASNGIKKVANKKAKSGAFTAFNLVFTNIPKSHLNTKISAKAYVCIDGVYFYSNILTRSFEGVARAVLADPDIDQSIKDNLNNLLEA